jgi:DNA sulfur modification protein DndD
MYLIRLMMVNFRQFYGENEIFFSTDPKKNVTLIHGENGVGKTTILNAIHWALFEKLTPDFQGKDELICRAAFKEGKKSCRVELEFEHENQRYNVNRHFDVDGKTKFTVHKIENGNYVAISLGKALINRVLPEEMAEYFFFHGEGLSDISSGKSGSKFRKAIRDILGFTFAEHAMKDLKNIKGKLLANIRDLESSQAALAGAADVKSRLEGRVIELEHDIEKSRDESASFSDQYEKLRRQIEDSGHEDASRLQRSVSSLESDIRGIQASIDSLEVDRQGLVQRYGWSVFGSALASKTLDFIDESTLKGRIPAPYDETLVRDLMETERCICGRDLLPATDPHKCVMALLETANTAIIQQRLLRARSVADKMKSQLTEFHVEAEKLESRLAIEHRKLGEKESELDQAESALREIKHEDINEYKSNALRAKSKLDDANRRLSVSEFKLDQIRDQIRDKDKEMARLGGNDQKFVKFQRNQQFVSQMIVRCEAKLDEYEASARGVIADSVNKILKTFSRNDFKIRLSGDFQFLLVDQGGEVVNKSKGQGLLLNLSFVSALIKFAEVRARSEGEFLVSGTVAPFVIDAPFGELDDTYRRAAACFLPTNSKQLILLLSSSHWNGPVEESIRGYVGQEYCLISNTSSARGEKPVDEIVILGKPIQLSRYERARDHTEILEVQ